MIRIQIRIQIQIWIWIQIRIATLVRHALVEVCTLPVLLVSVCFLDAFSVLTVFCS